MFWENMGGTGTARSLALALTALAPTLAAAETVEYDAGPQADAVLSVAQFRLHVPPGTGALRGTLVLLGGRNSDARGMADAAAWQTLAEETRFALLACYLKGTEQDHATYQLDEGGATARLIDKAIKELGDTTKRPELAKLPRALTGTSAGGNIAVAYAGHYPERTVGVAAVIPTVGHGPPSAKKMDVPILAVIGKNDQPDRVSFSMECYDGARGQKAVWTLALHQKRGHSGQGSQDLVLAFLRAVIAQRLDAAGASAPRQRPKSLLAKQGWLGDLASYNVSPPADFKGDKRNATWLPDEATAMAWQAFLRSP